MLKSPTRRKSEPQKSACYFFSRRKPHALAMLTIYLCAVLPPAKEQLYRCDKKKTIKGVSFQHLGKKIFRCMRSRCGLTRTPRDLHICSGILKQPSSPPTCRQPRRTHGSQNTTLAVGTNGSPPSGSCVGRGCRRIARARNRPASSCRRLRTASCWALDPVNLLMQKRRG